MEGENHMPRSGLIFPENIEPYCPLWRTKTALSKGETLIPLSPIKKGQGQEKGAKWPISAPRWAIIEQR